MNLRRFISNIVALTISIAAYACGPFDALTSNPFVFHFYQEEETPTIIDEQREDNIKEWKTLTSMSIPDSHIEAAVYDYTFEELNDAFTYEQSDNLFLKWIIYHKSEGIKDFLLLAKEVEELRLNRVSQWYYPADKKQKYDSRSEAERFESIIFRCKNHMKGFLSDRYGLQYVRTLWTLGRYKECIDFYNKNISKLPDNNLFKKMTKGYVAGCLRRTGDMDKSNSMYAEIGDFNSIIDNKKTYFTILVRNNPESDVIKSRLNQWIGYGDRNDNLTYIAVAEAALHSPKVVNRGDWLYLIAYIEEIYNRNHIRATQYVTKALDAKFSREEMRHDAEVMKLCLEAQQGILSRDLRYYLEVFQIDYHPFYFYIVPALLNKGQVSEALLLANYASNLERQHGYGCPGYSNVNHSFAIIEIRDNTYANTGFQLMQSRSAQEIINYKNYISTHNNLVEECIGHIRHDDDYLNEIIGTLFLREDNYDQAEKYFSNVSKDYEDNLNIKRCGYLYNNPWVNCYIPNDKWYYPSSKKKTMTDEQHLLSAFDPANSSLLSSDDNAKLNFAREMSRLKKIIKVGSPDESGLARIRYALARYNSFKACWALTQYWSGQSNQCNYQPFYWLWDGGTQNLTYLKELTGSVPDEKWLNAEIQKGLKQLYSSDAIAEAEFLMGHYRTIAKYYPTTQAGKYLSTHCDSWNNWLMSQWLCSTHR